MNATRTTGRDDRRPPHPSEKSRHGSAGERRGARRDAAPTPRTGVLARYERTLTSIMVGSTVRVARQHARVSQAELARRIGTSQPSIARLEQGHVSPTVISLDRIARALGSELVIDFEPLAEDRPLRGPQSP